MSLTFSRYVRFIFHVCPLLSLRVISLHLLSCRLVSLCFVSLSFPLHSPCFHFCPFHVPFSSPFFPFHFPLLSCHVDFLFPPLISLHFLAFPLCSPVFPAKKKRFFRRFRKEDVQQHRVVPDFRQKGAGSPSQQKSRQGESSRDPCFATPAPRRLRLVERHQIAARYVGIRRRAGGVILYPLVSNPTHRTMSADIYIYIDMFSTVTAEDPSMQLCLTPWASDPT